MGPDFVRPDIEIKMPVSYQQAPAENIMPLPEDKWWEAFGDLELNRLVEEVLKNNWDIRKATASILELQSLFVLTRADRFPSLGLQGEASRQSLSKNTFSVPGFSSGGKTTSYTLSLPAKFELDLWGRLARAEEAARADLLQAEENRGTVAQTIIAETINLYLEMESLERMIQLAEESIEYYGRGRSLIESRYERGLTSVLDLRQARRILAQAEAALPSLRQDLGSTQQRLSVLLGHYPKTRPPRNQPKDYFKPPPAVPPGLPSELLQQRPDIRMAEANLRALNARIGVAKAGRFPAITLTGSFGYSSNELEDLLLKSNSELWVGAIGIMQAVFDAGSLKAVQKGAEARYEKGVADYAKTVLAAFAEVENALLTRKEQLKRRERVINFLAEAGATQKAAETRYLRGLVDYLTVLDSQQARIQAEKDLIMVDLAILSNRVSLYRALGGGWDKS